MWLSWDAMAVRVAGESEGHIPERLTVGVAARLSQYLRVLTQAPGLDLGRPESVRAA